MSKPLRTNPAYAHLAYQKSLINKTILYLRRTFLGDEISDPREILVCEEVFQQDQQVPQEAVQHYIEKLTEEAAGLDVELRRFQLVAPINSPPGRNEQKNQKGPRKQHPKGGAQHGQGRRTH
jgi:hypothetical protein